MSFRFKLLTWIIAVNVVITGLLLWAILSNISAQSLGYRRNAENFEEQREEIIQRLGDILVFQEQMAGNSPSNVSPNTVIEWKEWKEFRDAMVRLDYMERDGKIVSVDILLNPLGKRYRTLDDERALEILDAAIAEDRLVMRGDAQRLEDFYIAIPIHFGEDTLVDSGESARVWGGALVQPRFPALTEPMDFFDWRLFWIAMAGGTLFLIMVTFTILSKVVIRPVEVMATAADRVAHGDYTVHCETTGSRDEIGRLITSFNFMVDEVRDYHHHLEDRVREAQARVQAAERHLLIAQRLASTGQLAAGIAHEINNPIGGMINAAMRLKEEAAKEGGSERQVVYLDLIVEGLGRIKDIVSKVLMFTPRSLTPASVSMKQLMRDTEALVEYRLKKENKSLEYEVTPDELSVYCEPGELRQVLLNLVINALDAVAEGEGRVKLTGCPLDDGKNVSITIEDNGCGMDTDELSRAFDLFYTTKEAGRGTGLGLSVAYNIVMNHGGLLEAESEPAKGTVIRVILPAK
jgi:signal transduction histidine kinase